MARDGRPSWQFYPGDWQKDPGIKTLDLEHRGFWFELLLMMFESEDRGKLVLAGQRMDDASIAQALGLELAKCQQMLSKIIANGVASRDAQTGALINRRMLRDEHLRTIRGVAGAKGGRKKASNASSKRLANSTPSSSSSSSSSSIPKPDEQNNPIEKYIQPNSANDPLENPADEEVARQCLILSKKLRSPNTLQIRQKWIRIWIARKGRDAVLEKFQSKDLLTLEVKDIDDKFFSPNGKRKQMSTQELIDDLIRKEKEGKL